MRFLRIELCLAFSLVSTLLAPAQSWQLTPENIDSAFRVHAGALIDDPFRPAFHLTPPAGCMGDPNGGIFIDGWYHIFYGLQPFAWHPGAWFWAHARSRDLLDWEHLPPGLTPAFELGLDAIGSGSTIITAEGKRLAFYSQSRNGPMEFWRAEFSNDDLSEWSHEGENPILTLDHPGLPSFDGFWRDPFVFSTEGRTFLIACADLFEENVVEVPIFEAKDEALTEWEYKGPLLTVPKHEYRNLEVPEIRPIGDQWIFIASTDAPVDRVNYFLGDFDTESLRFEIESEGAIDYSGHYYAQETIVDDDGNVYLMSWLPGWDREWLPYYMNEPQKNANRQWNGVFALPRELYLEEGQLMQRPVESLAELRRGRVQFEPIDLPVDGPTAAHHLLEDFRSNQFELALELNLHNAAFVGLNVLCDAEGQGELPIVWSGDLLNVDGVKVPMADWDGEANIELRIFVDKKFVEVFVNGGAFCVSRQVREEHVSGDRIVLTSLGGTGRLMEGEAWELAAIGQ